MSRCVRLSCVVGTISALLSSACADEPLAAPTVSQSAVVASVTPEVAAMLDGNGRFVFAPPAAADVPWISAGRARDLAVAFWKGYGPSLKGTMEEERDAGVADNLTPCRRVFLAESAYEPFAAEVSAVTRRTYGAKWLVSLCHGSEQQIAIAVAVEATNLTIDAGGIARGVRPGDFSVDGVPVGTTYPLEPELGTVGVAEKTTVRVSEIPRYRRRAHLYSALSGLWTYQVESSVRMRLDRSGAEVDTNWVGFFRWNSTYDLRPVASNPDSMGTSRSEFIPDSPDGIRFTTVEILRRSDVPVWLETFAVVRNP